MYLRTNDLYEVRSHLRLTDSWHPVTNDINVTDKGFSDVNTDVIAFDLVPDEIMKLDYLFWSEGDPQPVIGFKMELVLNKSSDPPEFNGGELIRLIEQGHIIKR